MIDSENCGTAMSSETGDIANQQQNSLVDLRSQNNNVATLPNNLNQQPSSFGSFTFGSMGSNKISTGLPAPSAGSLFGSQPSFGFGTSKSFFQPSTFPFPVATPSLNTSATVLTTAFDSDYGECLDFQFDFPLTSIRWEKTVDFNASPANPSIAGFPFGDFRIPSNSSSSQYPWRLQVEAYTESTSLKYSPDCLKKIVRAYLCNSGHSRNNAIVQLTICLVHSTTHCSCEDMISHPINYNNAPIGKGYGFEWQYKLTKFNRLFASDNKLSVRLRIASVLNNSDGSSSNIPKNSQLSTNFDDTQTVNNGGDNVLYNYVSLINNEDADFVFTLDSGLTIKVHKLILKVRFPYFAKMLAAANGQNHLLINGHSYETMMAVMMYIYSGHVELTSVEHALQVIRAATDFELPTLAVHANRYVTLNIRMENLFDVLILADQFKYDQIKDSCKEKLISAKRENPSKKLEQYDGYSKLVQYSNFHSLFTEILTGFSIPSKTTVLLLKKVD